MSSGGICSKIRNRPSDIRNLQVCFDSGKEIFLVGIAYRNALVGDEYYAALNRFDFIEGYDK
jgi:hypothetical protein